MVIKPPAAAGVDRGLRLWYNGGMETKKQVQPHEKKDRNRLLIEYYNTHRDEVSLTQIGKMFGISRQRVHRILKRAEKYNALDKKAG